MVIGWDAEAAGFTDETKNVIPAQHGDVIYTTTRPNHALLGSAAPMRYGEEYGFRPELFERLRRFFLFKAMHWSYEEEVRVVKCVFEQGLKEIPSGPLEKDLNKDGGIIYLASFPSTAIREIYLGLDSPILTGKEQPDILHHWKDCAKILQCGLMSDRWEMTASDYREPSHKTVCA